VTVWTTKRKTGQSGSIPGSGEISRFAGMSFSEFKPWLIIRLIAKEMNVKIRESATSDSVPIMTYSSGRSCSRFPFLNERS